MVDKRVSSLTKSLKLLLQIHRASHSALEEDLDWKAGTISRLLSGRTKLTLRHLVLLLRSLHVRLDEFSDMTFPLASRVGKKPKRRSLLHGSSHWDDLF
jgi:transcriptional regulator with XRE-family HTH domain